METNEGMMPSTPSTPPASSPSAGKQSERQRVRLRMSLFFDGTGNNMKNTETRIAGDQGHDPKGVYQRILASDAWRESSFFNDLSNVARLYKCADTVADYKYHFNVYTEGIGTLNEEEDSLRGNVTGGGDTGVVAKVDRGIANALAEISNKLNPQENYTLELITVDAFGFSRGAAAARHCVYRVLHSELANGKVSLRERLELLGYEVEKVETEAGLNLRANLWADFLDPWRRVYSDTA